MPSNSVYTYNHHVPQQLANIANWHKDRNLIDGATNETQFVKLFEEMLELLATITQMSQGECVLYVKSLVEDLYLRGRIKPPQGTDISDDAGDIMVVLVNMLERENISMQQALEKAWTDIKDRKGRMINGIFVKEADLEEK